MFSDQVQRRNERTGDDNAKKRKKDEEGKRRKKQKEGIRGKRESQRAWAEARGNQ